MPAPKKMAMTMTGSMSAFTMGLKRLSGNMPTITDMTVGDSFAVYSSAPSSALDSTGK